jgi:hypothetical protein
VNKGRKLKTPCPSGKCWRIRFTKQRRKDFIGTDGLFFMFAGIPVPQNCGINGKHKIDILCALCVFAVNKALEIQ